ncbi:FG-GAP-like repeat-containing protein [Streptomyces sp. NBC_00691]|uniref:FG-GAP-like repeat-containing protein n=1 Tax=Streptomyces sp. NBC_00691 TaxID=2903671 RepID=UPI002E30372B|nr:FG-GAP-like repeat-containing protein [Streptomyces sp. NBC_00691]
MSAGLLSAAPTGSATAATPASENAPASTQAERETRATAQALKEAKRTGDPVEIASRRTETDEVYINPDGTVRVDRAILPVRVRQGGKLVDIDPVLAQRSDGRVAPKASAMSVTFSGGGDDVFATMLREGRTVTLTWPHGKLPKPTVSGRTATYANVLPGVDLTATADDVSFSHALVVKTPAAAKNKAVRSVDFGVKTKGLQLASDATGGIAARTPSLNSVFSAPQPQMWDSAGTEAATPVDTKTPKSARPAARSLQDTLDGATEGSRTAKLGVKLGAGRITLTPDTALLDDPKTVFPVVIDPTWMPVAWKNAWSIAYKHTAVSNSENTVYYNGGTISDSARVGYANDTTRGGTVRANTYFNIPVANLWNKDVIESTLRIQQTHAGSWSCKSGDVLVRTIGKSLPKNITYNNQPAWGAIVDYSGKSFGGRNCPSDTAGLVEFDVTDAITDAAASGWGNWAFVLTSKSNAIDTSWRKFDPSSARVSTRYNTDPGRPKTSIDPSLPCAGGVIGTTDEIVLKATGLRDDEDTNLTVEFRYALNGAKTSTPRPVAATRGGTAMLRIVAGTTLPAGTYWYDAIVKDGTGSGDWAGRCYFTYDWKPPKYAPKVTSYQFPEHTLTTKPPACVGGVATGACNMPARTDGTFVFSMDSREPVKDVVEYVYWTDFDTKERPVKPAAAGGSVSIKVKPLNAGPQYLYVRGEDTANNRSPVKSYMLLPTRSASRDRLGDLNGDTMVDLVTVDPGTGTLWTYPGRGDGTFGAGVAADDASFAAGPVTNGGSWDDVDYYEDILVLQPAPDKAGVSELWAYRGDGSGRLAAAKPDEDASRRLKTIDEDETNWDGSSASENAHWRTGAEILSIPSVNDDDENGAIDDGDNPDLLVKEGASLWLYLGSRGGNILGAPIALGNADWQDMTVMTPGDLDKDGLPEIWARDKVKGTVHEYRSRKPATPDPSGVAIDLALFSDATVRSTSIDTGFTGTAYPHLATTGDFENDGRADLWSRNGAGRTVEFPGRAATEADPTAFGAERYVATTGYDWADCETFPAASGTGTFPVCGPILGKYKALGGPAGYGKPTSGVTNVSDGGRFVNFAQVGTSATDRTISWSKSTGAWAVSNGVFSKWNSTGRETGVLGYPTSDERLTHVLGGSVITFSKAGKAGAVYWRDGIGSQMIRGAVYSQYLALGGVAVFGYPTGDETATATKPGSVQHFRQGTSATDNVSFYWSSATGAWPVFGAIRTHWLSQGGHNGTLGFPKSTEKSVYGGRRTDFQNGYIRWNRESYQVASHAWTDRTAHLRTDLGGDYDGDGKTDVFTVYDYEKDSIGLYVAKANSDGGHNPPLEYSSEDPGDWNNSHSKWAAGDFDGDGRDDLMGFYGYSDGHVTAFSFLSQAAGTPIHRSSINLATGWDWNRSTPMAGDFNGDGRDDLAFVYDYGDGVMGVHTALARADGTFAKPVLSYKTAPGYWYAASASYTVGDTNGDGRDDLVGFYGYASGEARLFTFTAKADGTLAYHVGSWNVPAGTWERSRVKMTMADFDKDGREDLAVMYGYDDGRTEIRIFHARADGGFDTFVTPYKSEPGDWYATSTGNLVAGDVNGDARPDITVSYNYGDGKTRVFTFYGNESGTVDWPTRKWYADAGTW